MIYQLVQAGVGHVEVPPSRIEQIEVIPCLVQMFVLLVVVRQPPQVTLAERQVFKSVFEDDTRMEEGLLDDSVTGSLLVLSEGDLREVVLAFVRIVGEGVCCRELIG